MPQNRFWNLLSKKLSGEALPEELRELEQLVKDHPELVYAAERIEGLWAPQPPDPYDAELAFELHLHKLQEHGITLPELNPPGIHEEAAQPPSRSYKKIWTAALIVAGFACAIFFWQQREAAPTPVKKSFSSEVSTRPGSKSTHMVLPDSSVVWLNGGSRLSYNEQYGATNRNIQLSGEAFFDVKKSTIPFIIHTGSLQIKVLGTAFNVKAYPDEPTTETSLVRGRVEITLDKRPGETYILKPNEKLVVANETVAAKETAPSRKTPLVMLSGLTHSRQDSSIIETSWVDNKLVFQDESFADLAIRLERWFGMKISFSDPELGRERLSGTFTTETVQEALQALQITTPFHFSLKANTIIITP